MDSKELRLIKEAYASIHEGYGKKEEKEEGCVSKSEKGKHNCAKKVCHESFGEGTCIFGEHAVPDENGFVSHYDVMFEHGIEKNVPVADMEVLEESSHNEENHRYEGEQLDENPVIDALRSRLKKIGVSGTSPALDRERRANENQRRLGQESLRRAGVGQTERPTGALNNSADLFDIVKGHLMSEGYADTEEAALAIMANMSEEWRNEIVEQNMITRTGTSTNAAGEKIKWTDRYNKDTGRSTVTDKYGTRDSTPLRPQPQRPRPVRDDM